ncbi:MAG: radical SAM family heme chaperone HemW [Lachnospiraceae bacterium]
MKDLELYIHIPFCKQKCDYCDFLSAVADKESQSAYIEALIREIAFYGRTCAEQYLITSIFIGGGTPSLIETKWMRTLLKALSSSFALAEDLEFTIECNPVTLTRDKLTTYKEFGIDRLSIGLQSVNNKELKLLGRIHTYEEFLESYELARSVGFSNINIDLISSIPGQTAESFTRTLEKTIQLSPEHISAYSLIIEPGTPFFDRYALDVKLLEQGKEPKFLPDEDTEYSIGKLTNEILINNGYERYEISNYAKKGYSCRHNIGYWKRNEYLGLGLGASSLMNEQRSSNTRSMLNYLRSSPSVLRETTFALGRKEQMEEFLFLGLRMTNGISRSAFYEKFGIVIEQIYGEQIQKMIREEMLLVTRARVMLTEKGLDLSNYVLTGFLIES